MEWSIKNISKKTHYDVPLIDIYTYFLLRYLS